MEIENGINYTPKKAILTEIVICPYCSESVKVTERNSQICKKEENMQPLY